MVGWQFVCYYYGVGWEEGVFYVFVVYFEEFCVGDVVCLVDVVFVVVFDQCVLGQGGWGVGFGNQDGVGFGGYQFENLVGYIGICVCKVFVGYYVQFVYFGQF